MTDPSTNGANGRDTRGRFVKGNAGGPGNPNIQHVAKLRDGFRSACSVADVRAICRKLVALAKRGNVRAAQLVLDRTLGRCEPASDHLGANDPNIFPVIEVLVSDRNEVIEFNQIREQILMQLRQAGAGPVFAGLPAPAND